MLLCIVILKKIITSLINRSWYEIDEDHKHPTIAVPDWADLPQVGRAAHYVKYVRDLIDKLAGQEHYDLEDLVGNEDALRQFFKGLGLAFYPLLAKDIIATTINANKYNDLSGFDALSVQDQNLVGQILDDLIGYAPLRTDTLVLNPRAFSFQSQEIVTRRDVWNNVGVDCSLELATIRVKQIKEKQGVFEAQSETHGSISFFRKSKKSPLKKLQWDKSNTEIDMQHVPGQFYKITINGLKTVGFWQLLALVYDQNKGLLESKRIVSRLCDENLVHEFSIRGSGANFRIVLYAPKSNEIRRIQLDQFNIQTKLQKRVQNLKDPLNYNKHLVLAGANIHNTNADMVSVIKMLSETKFKMISILNLDVELDEINKLSKSADTHFITIRDGINFFNLSDTLAKSEDSMSFLRRILKGLKWGTGCYIKKGDIFDSLQKYKIDVMCFATVEDQKTWQGLAEHLGAKSMVLDSKNLEGFISEISCASISK